MFLKVCTSKYECVLFPNTNYFKEHNIFSKHSIYKVLDVNIVVNCNDKNITVVVTQYNRSHTLSIISNDKNVSKISVYFMIEDTTRKRNVPTNSKDSDKDIEVKIIHGYFKVQSCQMIIQKGP